MPIFDMINIKIEKVYKFPFQHTAQAIQYLRTKNPARQKYVNILEMEAGQKPTAEEFSGEHPSDIFASTLLGLKKACADKKNQDVRLFELYYFTDDYHLDALAEKFQITSRHARKLIKNIRQEFEQELIRRELLEPQIYDD